MLSASFTAGRECWQELENQDFYVKNTLGELIPIQINRYGHSLCVQQLCSKQINLFLLKAEFYKYYRAIRRMGLRGFLNIRLSCQLFFKRSLGLRGSPLYLSFNIYITYIMEILKAVLLISIIPQTGIDNSSRP
jgi:hypothetical protein